MRQEDKKSYPSYCCQECGALIGYIGRFFQWLARVLYVENDLHRCKRSNNGGQA
jgi:hypothetical protein